MVESKTLTVSISTAVGNFISKMHLKPGFSVLTKNDFFLEDFQGVLHDIIFFRKSQQEHDIILDYRNRTMTGYMKYVLPLNTPVWITIRNYTLMTRYAFQQQI